MKRILETNEQVSREVIESADFQERLLSFDDMTDFSKVGDDMDELLFDTHNNIMI